MSDKPEEEPKKDPVPAARSRQHWVAMAVCLFLAGLVWVVFGQTLNHDLSISMTTITW